MCIVVGRTQLQIPSLRQAPDGVRKLLGYSFKNHIMPDNRLRDYSLTDIPTIDNISGKDDLLKQIYSEVNSNYRNLADIRFKLLGFVPAISVIAWVELINKINPADVQKSIFGLAVALLALRIIFGIRIYDQRNDELYNDLVSRGRKIESELNINTGIFNGRLKANKVDIFLKKDINHGRALNLIYSSVVIGWILLLLWYSVNLVIHLIN